MNQRLVRLAAATVMAIATVSAQAKDWKVVRVAVEGVYPPFNYMDKGQLVGFDVDIAKALCSKMQVQCQFTTQEWDGMIPGLMSGKYDAIISSMAITDERKQKVDFSDKYYATPARFIAAKDTDIKDVSPKALEGKTIGVQGSTTQATYLQDQYKNSTIKTYKSVDDANMDLAAGRIDLVMSDSVLLYEFLSKTKDGSCCKFVGPEIRNEKYFGPGKGIAVRKDSDDLRDKFNVAIKQILSDGTYKTINAKYFPFSVY
ncbi:lysine/arginine/ornithine ABC transporter substrate-binding protein [Paraburkholderia sp. BR13439]|uniref:lysine/arginine/ornithine ABC transporter substrate-binding protein n=1 Tax=unclassified Paraburkholderia TaxID=2615204 RepID=UPI0034D00CA8